MHEELTNKSKITNEDVITWLKNTANDTKDLLKRIESIGIKTEEDRAIQEDVTNLLHTCNDLSNALTEGRKLTPNQKETLMTMLRGVLLDLERGIIGGTSLGIDNYIKELF